jgi:hypothetical protein
MAIGPLLSMRALLVNYSTAVPLDTFRAMSYLVVLMSAVFGYVIYAGCAAVVLSFFPDTLAVFRRKRRRLLARDAVFALLGGIGLGFLLHQAGALLPDRFHAQALFDVSPPDLLASALPALSAFADLRSIVLYGAILALAALLVARLPRRWMLVACLLLAGFLFLPLDMRTGGEFALQYGIALLTIGAAALFCFTFGRGNILAYAVVFAVLAERVPLVELFGNPAPGFSVQGWIVAAILAVLVLWAVLPAAGRPVE